MTADLAQAQRTHWQSVYQAHPHMYGDHPSEPARYAATLFSDHRGGTVLELGAGHGRDSLYFARQGFAVHATDFSPSGLDQLRARGQQDGLAGSITTAVHDARTRIPLPSHSVDGAFAHMLFCMALSTPELHNLITEIHRVLRPGGSLVYTVRHTGDAHYGSGIAHGDDIYEHGGFAVHFFSRALVDSLAEGWNLQEVHAFEEGELPRRLWRITQYKP